MSEDEAVTIVVNDLRLDLWFTEVYLKWDLQAHLDLFWTIYDVNGVFF